MYTRIEVVDLRPPEEKALRLRPSADELLALPENERKGFGIRTIREGAGRVLAHDVERGETILLSEDGSATVTEYGLKDVEVDAPEELRAQYEGSKAAPEPSENRGILGAFVRLSNGSIVGSRFAEIVEVRRRGSVIVSGANPRTHHLYTGRYRGLLPKTPSGVEREQLFSFGPVLYRFLSENAPEFGRAWATAYEAPAILAVVLGLGDRTRIPPYGKIRSRTLPELLLDLDAVPGAVEELEHLASGYRDDEAWRGEVRRVIARLPPVYSIAPPPISTEEGWLRVAARYLRTSGR